MTMTKKLTAALFAIAIVATNATASFAQDNYPTRPVKLMIGFPVGGLLDTVSRIGSPREIHRVSGSPDPLRPRGLSPPSRA